MAHGMGGHGHGQLARIDEVRLSRGCENSNFSRPMHQDLAEAVMPRGDARPGT